MFRMNFEIYFDKNGSSPFDKNGSRTFRFNEFYSELFRFLKNNNIQVKSKEYSDKSHDYHLNDL